MEALISSMTASGLSPKRPPHILLLMIGFAHDGIRMLLMIRSRAGAFGPIDAIGSRRIEIGSSRTVTANPKTQRRIPALAGSP